MGLLFSVGCHRDIPALLLEETNERVVTFRVSGFESDVIPLSDHAPVRTMDVADGQPMALHNITPSPEPQLLYYWSFNAETLLPDIAVDEEHALITFDAAEGEPGFVSGYKFDAFEAGRALSIKAARSLVVNLPVAFVESIADFSFDIKSSGTGPKDFSIAYSTDGGVSYEHIRESNQFEKTKSDQWNHYEFNVGGLLGSMGEGNLLIKLVFLEGNREGTGEYNPNAGAVHLDNLRLSGIYNGGPGGDTDPASPNTLRYYVFSSESGALVAQEELAMAQLPDDGTLSVKLPPGIYDIVFLAYRLRGEVLLPEEVTHKSEFYFGHHFDDYRAVTYALLKGSFSVGDMDITEPAVLARCFSLVTFDFTDSWEDLKEVRKVEVVRQHDNYYYSPFGDPVEEPMSDANTVLFDGLATKEDYPLALHQFVGLSDYNVPISYELTAYDSEGKKLNTVVVKEEDGITNNVQLRFRGRLLGDRGRFSIGIDTDWGETVDHDFH